MSRKFETPEQSCTNIGDNKALADQLIRIGLLENDPAALERARSLYREGWPDQVADAHFKMVLTDTKKDLAQQDQG